MPFGSSKAAILGASGGGASLTLSGGTDFTYDGVDYHKFTSSGTLTIEGSGKVEYVIVGGGGGGGYSSNQSWGSGGGGGGGGIAWGTNYLLDSSYRSTFSIEIGSGGAGSTGTNQASSGGHSTISDWGKATSNTYNFDWSGGTTFTSQGDKCGAHGGGGGGRGGWGECESGGYGNGFGGSSEDWGSGGSGAGGGGWNGYCAGGGNQGGSWRLGATYGSTAAIQTVYSGNGDGSNATHYVTGNNGGMGAGGTNGEMGMSTLAGTLFVNESMQTSRTGTGGDVDEANRPVIYAGIRIGGGGAGGNGNWYNSADGVGRGCNQGGSKSAADNQGGGGAGGGNTSCDGNYHDGGAGGSGIMIFRVIE